MFKRIISFCVLITFVSSLSLSTGLCALPNYQQYNEKKLKKFLDDAREAKDIQTYERIAETGLKVVEAEWEMLFDAYAKEEGKTTDEVKEDKNREKSALQAELNQILEKEKKNWQVRTLAREWIAQESNEKDGKIAQFKGAMEKEVDEYIKKFYEGFNAGQRNTRVQDAFSEYIKGEVADKRKLTFGELLADLKQKLEEGLGLSGVDFRNLASLEGYDEGLKKTLQNVYDEWDVELKYIVTRSQNRFDKETGKDAQSLKTKSEADSAKKIIDGILEQTESELKKVEENVLNPEEDTYHQESLETSKFGGDFSKRVEQELEKGIELWETARKKLVDKWKSTLNEGMNFYEEGQREWREGYNYLLNKRKAWIRTIQDQIREGSESWREKSGEMDDNLVYMQEKLDAYLTNQKGSWDNYSSQIYDSLMSSNNMVSEIDNQLIWLEEQVAKKKELVNNEVKEKGADISVKLISSSKYNNSKIQVNSYETTNSWTGYQLLDFIPSYGNDGTMTFELKVQYGAFSRYKFEGLNLTSYYKRTTYTYHFTLDQFKIFNNDFFEGDNNSINRWLGEIETYTKEIQNVKTMKDSLLKSFSGLEKMFYGQGLMGEDGMDGLLSADEADNSDMYMMSDAEFEYEEYKKLYEYWLKKLYAAQGVYEYAYSRDTGTDTEQETLQRLDETRKTLEALQAKYNNLLGKGEDYSGLTLKEFDDGSYEMDYTGIISKEKVSERLAELNAAAQASGSDADKERAKKAKEALDNYGTLKGLRAEIALMTWSINDAVTDLEAKKKAHKDMLQKLLIKQNESMIDGIKDEGFNGYTAYINAVKDYFRILTEVDGSRASEKAEMLSFFFSGNEDMEGVFQSYRKQELLYKDFAELTGYNEGSNTFSGLEYLAEDYGENLPAEQRTVKEAEKQEKIQRLMGHFAALGVGIPSDPLLDLKDFYENRFNGTESLSEMLANVYAFLKDDKDKLQEFVNLTGCTVTENSPSFEESKLGFLKLAETGDMEKSKKLLKFLESYGASIPTATPEARLTGLYELNKNKLLSSLYQVISLLKARRDNYKDLADAGFEKFIGQGNAVDESIHELVLSSIVEQENQISLTSLKTKLEDSLGEIKDNVGLTLQNKINEALQDSLASVIGENKTKIQEVLDQLSSEKIYTGEDLFTFLEKGLAEDEVLNKDLVVALEKSLKKFDILMDYQDVAKWLSEEAGKETNYADYISKLFASDHITEVLKGVQKENGGNNPVWEDFDVTTSMIREYGGFEYLFGVSDYRYAYFPTDLLGLVSQFNDIYGSLKITASTVNYTESTGGSKEEEAQAIIAGAEDFLRKVLQGEIPLSSDLEEMYKTSARQLAFYVQAGGTSTLDYFSDQENKEKELNLLGSMYSGLMNFSLDQYKAYRTERLLVELGLIEDRSSESDWEQYFKEQQKGLAYLLRDEKFKDLFETVTAEIWDSAKVSEAKAKLEEMLLTEIADEEFFISKLKTLYENGGEELKKINAEFLSNLREGSLTSYFGFENKSELEAFLSTYENSIEGESLKELFENITKDGAYSTDMGAAQAVIAPLVRANELNEKLLKLLSDPERVQTIAAPDFKMSKYLGFETSEEYNIYVTNNTEFGERVATVLDQNPNLSISQAIDQTTSQIEEFAPKKDLFSKLASFYEGDLFASKEKELAEYFGFLTGEESEEETKEKLKRFNKFLSYDGDLEQVVGYMKGGESATSLGFLITQMTETDFLNSKFAEITKKEERVSDIKKFYAQVSAIDENKMKDISETILAKYFGLSDDEEGAGSQTALEKYRAFTTANTGFVTQLNLLKDEKADKAQVMRTYVALDEKIRKIGRQLEFLELVESVKLPTEEEQKNYNLSDAASKLQEWKDKEKADDYKAAEGNAEKTAELDAASADGAYELPKTGIDKADDYVAQVAGKQVDGEGKITYSLSYTDQVKLSSLLKLKELITNTQRIMGLSADRITAARTELAAAINKMVDTTKMEYNADNIRNIYGGTPIEEKVEVKNGVVVAKYGVTGGEEQGKPWYITTELKEEDDQYLKKLEELRGTATQMDESILKMTESIDYYMDAQSISGTGTEDIKKEVAALWKKVTDQEAYVAGLKVQMESLQTSLNGMHTKYISLMNQVNDTRKELENAKTEYDRAYDKYEFAKTSYLYKDEKDTNSNTLYEENTKKELPCQNKTNCPAAGEDNTVANITENTDTEEDKSSVDAKGSYEAALKEFLEIEQKLNSLRETMGLKEQNGEIKLNQTELYKRIEVLSVGADASMSLIQTKQLEAIKNKLSGLDGFKGAVIEDGHLYLELDWDGKEKATLEEMITFYNTQLKILNQDVTLKNVLGVELIFAKKETGFNELKTAMGLNREEGNEWRSAFLEKKIAELSADSEFSDKWEDYEEATESYVSAENLEEAVSQRVEALKSAKDAKAQEIDVYVSKFFGGIPIEKIKEALGETLYADFLKELTEKNLDFNDFMQGVDAYQRTQIASIPTDAASLVLSFNSNKPLTSWNELQVKIEVLINRYLNSDFTKEMETKFIKHAQEVYYQTQLKNQSIASYNTTVLSSLLQSTAYDAETQSFIQSKITTSNWNIAVLGSEISYKLTGCLFTGDWPVCNDSAKLSNNDPLRAKYVALQAFLGSADFKTKLQERTTTLNNYDTAIKNAGDERDKNSLGDKRIQAIKGVINNTLSDSWRDQVMYDLFSTERGIQNVHRFQSESSFDATANQVLKNVVKALATYQNKDGQRENLAANWRMFTNYNNLVMKYVDVVKYGAGVVDFITSYKQFFGLSIRDEYEDKARYNEYFVIYSLAHDDNPWYKSAKKRFEVRIGQYVGHCHCWGGGTHARSMDRGLSNAGAMDVKLSVRMKDIGSFTGKDGTITSNYLEYQDMERALEQENNYNFNLTNQKVDVENIDNLETLRDKLVSCVREYIDPLVVDSDVVTQFLTGILTSSGDTLTGAKLERVQEQMAGYEQIIELINDLDLTKAEDKELFTLAIKEINAAFKRNDAGNVTDSTIQRSLVLDAVSRLMDALSKRKLAEMEKYIEEKRAEELEKIKKETGEEKVNLSGDAAIYDMSLLLRKRLAYLKTLGWSDQSLTKVYLANGTNVNKNLTKDITFTYRGSGVYNRLSEELLKDISQKIFNNMIKQQSSLKQMEMNLKKTQFEEDNADWQEKVNTVFSRGLSQWDKGLEQFREQWDKWNEHIKEQLAALEDQGKEELKKFDKKMNNWLSDSNRNAAKGYMVNMPKDMVESAVKSFSDNVDSFALKKDMPDVDSLKEKILGGLEGQFTLPAFMMQKAKMADTSVSFSMAVKGEFVNTQKENWEKNMDDFKSTMARMNNYKIFESLEDIIQKNKETLVNQDLKYYEELVPSMVSSLGFFWDNEKYYERKIEKDASLVGGVEYKTQKLGVYKKFSVPDFKMEVKDQAGNDFSARSIESMKDDELDILFDMVTMQVNVAMKDNQKAFEKHVNAQIGEGGTLIKAIEKLEQEKAEGEAALDNSYWDMPIIPGVPLSVFDITKIGAAIAMSMIPGVGALTAALVLASMEAGHTLANGGGFDDALLAGGMTFATSYLGGMNYGLGSFGNAATGTFISNFGGGMAQRAIEGKSLDWDAIGDLAVSSTIKAAVAGGGAYLAKDVIGNDTWGADFAGNLTRNTLNAAGNYAAWEVVDKGRFQEDMYEQLYKQYKDSGMDESEAKERAKSQAKDLTNKQSKSLMAESLKGLAVSTLVDLSVAGLNAAMGNEYGSKKTWNETKGEFEDIYGWQNQDKISGNNWKNKDNVSFALDLVSRVGIDILATKLGNEIAGEDLLSTSLTMVSMKSILSSMQRNGKMNEGALKQDENGMSVFSVLMSSEDVGFSYIIAGKKDETYGRFKNGAGDVDFAPWALYDAYGGLKDALYLGNMRSDSENRVGKGKDYGEYNIAATNALYYHGKDQMAEKVRSGDFIQHEKAQEDFLSVCLECTGDSGYGKAFDGTGQIYLSKDFITNYDDPEAQGNFIRYMAAMMHEQTHLDMPGKNKIEEFYAAKSEIETVKIMEKYLGTRGVVSGSLQKLVENQDKLEEAYDKKDLGGFVSVLLTERDITGIDLDLENYNPFKASFEQKDKDMLNGKGIKSIEDILWMAAFDYVLKKAGVDGDKLKEKYGNAAYEKLRNLEEYKGKEYNGQSLYTAIDSTWRYFKDLNLETLNKIGLDNIKASNEIEILIGMSPYYDSWMKVLQATRLNWQPAIEAFKKGNINGVSNRPGYINVQERVKLVADVEVAKIVHDNTAHSFYSEYVDDKLFYYLELQDKVEKLKENISSPRLEERLVERDKTKEFFTGKKDEDAAKKQAGGIESILKTKKNAEEVLDEPKYDAIREKKLEDGKKIIFTNMSIVQKERNQRLEKLGVPFKKTVSFKTNPGDKPASFNEQEKDFGNLSQAEKDKNLEKSAEMAKELEKFYDKKEELEDEIEKGNMFLKLNGVPTPGYFFGIDIKTFTKEEKEKLEKNVEKSKKVLEEINEKIALTGYKFPELKILHTQGDLGDLYKAKDIEEKRKVLQESAEDHHKSISKVKEKIDDDIEKVKDHSQAWIKNIDNDENILRRVIAEKQLNDHEKSKVVKNIALGITAGLVNLIPVAGQYISVGISLYMVGDSYVDYSSVKTGYRTASDITSAEEVTDARNAFYLNTAFAILDIGLAGKALIAKKLSMTQSTLKKAFEMAKKSSESQTAFIKAVMKSKELEHLSPEDIERIYQFFNNASGKITKETMKELEELVPAILGKVDPGKIPEILKRNGFDKTSNPSKVEVEKLKNVNMVDKEGKVIVGKTDGENFYVQVEKDEWYVKKIGKVKKVEETALEAGEVVKVDKTKQYLFDRGRKIAVNPEKYSEIQKYGLTEKVTLETKNGKVVAERFKDTNVYMTKNSKGEIELGVINGKKRLPIKSKGKANTIAEADCGYAKDIQAKVAEVVRDYEKATGKKVQVFIRKRQPGSGNFDGNIMSKPQGAKNKVVLPNGVRIVELPNGEIKLALSDGDTYMILVDGKLADEKFSWFFTKKLDKAINFELFDNHGPNVWGVIRGEKGAFGPDELNESIIGIDGTGVFTNKAAKETERLYMKEGLEPLNQARKDHGLTVNEAGGVNQSSTAILKNGYYEVNGFKITEKYYTKLWNEGREVPSLRAEGILENFETKIPVQVGRRPNETFNLYIQRTGENKGWEMLYNPNTKEIYHLQPIKLDGYKIKKQWR